MLQKFLHIGKKELSASLFKDQWDYYLDEQEQQTLQREADRIATWRWCVVCMSEGLSQLYAFSLIHNIYILLKLVRLYMYHILKLVKYSRKNLKFLRLWLYS